MEGIALCHYFVSGVMGRAIGGEHPATMLIKKQFHSCLQGHCFSDDTEILTPGGWKRHDQLVVGSEVMTLNRDSGNLEYQHTTDMFRYTHHKTMVHVSGGPLDLLVTPDHGLWTKVQDSYWRESSAIDNFGTRRLFLCSGEHDTSDIQLSDSQIRVLAWIMAEGNIQNNGSSSYHIRISQSDAPDGRLGILERDLSYAGIEFSKNLQYKANTAEHGSWRNYDAYRLGIKNSTGHLMGWVCPFLSPDKTPTRKLAEMSPRQARVFLDTYTLADGTHYGRGRQISSNRQDYIDLLQELGARSGFRSSTCKRGSGVISLYLNDRGSWWSHKNSWKMVPYDGVTWCVSVPNHTLLVRRNGKTAITMNSHQLDYADRVDASGRPVLAMHCGCYFDYEMDWAGWQPNQMYSRGLLVLRNVREGQFDPEWWSLARVQARYG